MGNKSILFLRGEIGSGKTTLLKKHLAAAIPAAGGFFTRRISDFGSIRGIEIMSAKEYLSESRAEKTLICSFKDGVPSFNYEPMREYFNADDKAPFYLFDEIGGIELLDPRFIGDFRGVMERGKPIIAVLKSCSKDFLPSRALGSEHEYQAAYAEFCEMIKSFPQSKTAEYSGFKDSLCEKAVCGFIKENIYARFI